MLFVPGDRLERFDKAAASGADEIILDLEDPVAPAAKGEARAADWLESGWRAIVRVNGVDTPWHEADTVMLEAACEAGVMLPKADASSIASARWWRRKRR